MEIDGNREIDLKLSLMDIQVIQNLLGEAPAKISMGIIARIDRQVKDAIKPELMEKENK